MARHRFDPRILEYFARYRDIIGDWESFCAALQRPLPQCIWSNPLRIAPQGFEAHLRADGIQFEALPWISGAYRLVDDTAPGTHWTYLAGLCHIQEEVSMIPPLALDPQPGETVLDMCAAPGNKTAQIAAMMQSRGTVVANDATFGRFPGMRGTLERLGALNVVLTNYDATTLDTVPLQFDRVLADVPCSCEGTTRKNSQVVRRIANRPLPANSADVFPGIRTQEDILRRAVYLCRPGGTIVYATCTYAPEENEAVVNKIVQEFGDNVLTIGEIRLAGLIGSPGIEHWLGQEFHADMHKTLRVWPHQNDSGGFYVAKLQRTSADLPALAPATHKKINKNGSPAAPYHFHHFEQHQLEVTELAEYLQIRFGISLDFFNTYKLYQPTPAQIFVADQNTIAPPMLQQHTLGMALCRIGTRREPKLSKDGAKLLAPLAKRHVLEMNKTQRDLFLSRQDIEIDAGDARDDLGDWKQGYIIMIYAGAGLGVGFYRPGRKAIESLFPKALAR